MTDEHGKFIDDLRHMDHDEQTAAIILKDTEFLKRAVVFAALAQENAINWVNQGHPEDLHYVIERTYTYTIIVTVLRMRGQYGRITIMLDGSMKVGS